MAKMGLSAKPEKIGLPSSLLDDRLLSRRGEMERAEESGCRIETQYPFWLYPEKQCSSP
jgi:hypothetical protein